MIEFKRIMCSLSGCISRYSAGSVYYYPSYHHQHSPVQVQKLQKELQRYLTRKIGFEAVMRIRCTKGGGAFFKHLQRHKWSFVLNCLYFWLFWVFLAARGLSLLVASRGHSLLQCTGCSLRWLLLLQQAGPSS